MGVATLCVAYGEQRDGRGMLGPARWPLHDRTGTRLSPANLFLIDRRLSVAEPPMGMKMFCGRSGRQALTGSHKFAVE